MSNLNADKAMNFLCIQDYYWVKFKNEEGKYSRKDDCSQCKKWLKSITKISVFNKKTAFMREKPHNLLMKMN